MMAMSVPAMTGNAVSLVAIANTVEAIHHASGVRGYGPGAGTDATPWITRAVARRARVIVVVAIGSFEMDAITNR